MLMATAAKGMKKNLKTNTKDKHCWCFGSIWGLSSVIPYFKSLGYNLYL